MNKSHSSHFLGSLSTTAAIFAEKIGVELRIGTNARTNGKVIEIPIVTDDRALSKEEIIGFILHESCHIRYTDFSAVSKNRSPLLANLTNALEDARIEREIASVYPGSDYIFGKTYQPYLEKFSDPSCYLSPASMYGLYICSAAESTHTRIFDKVKPILRERCVKALGEEIMSKTDDELRCFPSLKNTSEVEESALRLIKILESSVSSDQSQPPESSFDSEDEDNDSNQNQQEDNAPTDNSQNGDNRKAGNSSKTKNSQSETSNTGSTQDEASQNEDGSASDQTCPDASGSQPIDVNSPRGKRIEKMLNSKKCESFDISRNLKQKLNAAKNTEDSNLVDAARMNFKLSVPMRCDRSLIRLSHIDRGRELLRASKSDSALARRALAGMVQAKTRQGIRTANSGRKIQTSKLSNLMVGSCRIFEKRDEIKLPDTAVSILLDMSGSMCGTEALALRASLALMTALRSIPKVNSDLKIFPTCRFFKSYELRSEEACATIIPFNERLEKLAGSIGLAEADGGTPIIESMMRTGLELSQRNEPRKIMITITDGYCDQSVQRTVNVLSQAGITVVGIGINVPDLDDKFPISACISDITQLQKALLDIAKKLFVDEVL